MRTITGALLIATLTTGIFCIVPHAEAARRMQPARQETSMSLTPILGSYFFDGSEQLQIAPMAGVKFGYDIVRSSIYDSLGIEATYNYLSTRSKNGSGTNSGNLFRVDAIYPFNPKVKLVPFLAIGIGGISLGNKSHTDTNALLNYGGGIKYFFDKNLALRMDLRHIIVYDDISTRSNYEVSFGVSYYFGKEIKK